MLLPKSTVFWAVFRLNFLAHENILPNNQLAKMRDSDRDVNIRQRNAIQHRVKLKGKNGKENI